MSSSRVIYYPFAGVNAGTKVSVAREPQSEALNPVRGMLLGLMFCLPAWGVAYLIFRAIF